MITWCGNPLVLIGRFCRYFVHSCVDWHFFTASLVPYCSSVTVLYTVCILSSAWPNVSQADKKYSADCWIFFFKMVIWYDFVWVCDWSMIYRLTEAERRDWPVMSRDQDGSVNLSAWNSVNASSSEVFASGAHRLDKMLIRSIGCLSYAVYSGCMYIILFHSSWSRLTLWRVAIWVQL